MNTQLRKHEATTEHTDDRQLTIVETTADDPDAATDDPDIGNADDQVVSPPPTRLVPVVNVISTITHHEIGVLLGALQRRNTELRDIRAREAAVGKRIIVSDIVPRYLDGLAGDIEQTDGQWVAVRLDEPSTGRLRFCGQTDYDVGSTQRFLLPGVPASLCFDPDELLTTA